MNPWLRLLGVLGAVIVGALLLKVLPPAVVLLVFIVGALFLNRVLRARARAEGERSESSAHGLRHEARDPFGLLAYPLSLFARGRTPVIEDLSWGTWRALDVKRFDVTFDPVLELEGAERPRFACALAPLDAPMPALVIEPWTFVTRLSAEAPMAQVSTGSETLDRVMHVRCDDAAFVAALVDEPMATWLASLGDDWGFEVSGRIALLYGPASSSAGVVPVLEVLQSFLVRIPAGLRSGGGSEED